MDGLVILIAVLNILMKDKAYEGGVEMPFTSSIVKTHLKRLERSREVICVNEIDDITGKDKIT